MVMRVRRTDLWVLVSERKVSRRADSLCSSASEISNLSLLYFISQRLIVSSLQSIKRSI